MNAIEDSMTPEVALEALRHASRWVLDIDGSLVRTDTPGGAGGVPIPGASDLIAWLRSTGREFVVCTNASVKTATEYAQHLRSIGLDVSDRELMTAATAAAAHVASRHAGARVLVVGDRGLDQALRDEGFACVPPNDPGADVVVVGGATTYATAAVNAACLAIADRGAAFYVTVDHPWFHGGNQRSISASSAIAAAIAWVTGKRPEVCGKPSPAIAGVLARRLGTSGHDVVVIGDVAAIDIRLARRMGALGVLVFSGGTPPEAVAGLPVEDRPHLCVDDVGDLLKRIGTI